MKKLFLLSALLIFACSSDDSSDDDDNSNQTFLDRYDGVVWEYISTNNQGEELLEKYMFTNTPKAFFYRGDDLTDTWCNTYLYNTPYPDGSIAQIIENLGDILIVEKTYVSHTEFINWEVIDNGNRLTGTGTSTDINVGEVYNFTANRTFYPQISCN